MCVESFVCLQVSSCEILNRIDHFHTGLMPNLNVISIAFQGLKNWPSYLVELLKIILHCLSDVLVDSSETIQMNVNQIETKLELKQ